jgi:hypothetical protein
MKRAGEVVNGKKNQKNPTAKKLTEIFLENKLK